MEMHAANNMGINILSTAILWFSGHSPSGQLLETCQLTCITNYWKFFSVERPVLNSVWSLATFLPSMKSCHTTIFRPTSGSMTAHLRHRLFIQSFPLIVERPVLNSVWSLTTFPPSMKSYRWTMQHQVLAISNMLSTLPSTDTAAAPRTKENREKLQAWLIDNSVYFKTVHYWLVLDISVSAAMRLSYGQSERSNECCGVFCVCEHNDATSTLDVVIETILVLPVETK